MPPPLKEMISQLIATPSISSTLPAHDLSNESVIELLATWLEPLGFSITIIPIPGKPGKSNLIARRGSGTDALVLSGHTDTVPLDEDLWQMDPFKLTEIDGNWYGLGSCDMKSFFALVIEAIEPLLDQKFYQPLIILATADEESSMSGARALSAAELGHARYALIGEPTGLKPINQHKGIMMVKARIRGTSGHSSNPSLGLNALDASAILINELIDFRTSLTNHHNPLFEVAQPTMNLGCIHGGDNPNRICDHVDLSFDVRILPGMSNEDILEELKGRLENRLLPLSCEVELLHPPVPPFINDQQELASLAHTITGAEPGAVAFATEAPFLTALGMETLVLGPGSIDQAHQPNEFLPEAHISPAIDIIRSLVTRFCLHERPPNPH